MEQNFKISFNYYMFVIMNQETAQAEDKCKNIDESNCKNSTLLNLLQKWKKLIDLKNADASRKGSLSLTSSNDPKRKRTSGILLCILFILIQVQSSFSQYYFPFINHLQSIIAAYSTSYFF